MLRLLAVVLLGTALALAASGCSDDGGSGSETTVVAGVQRNALAAADKLSSSTVVVDGRIEQQDKLATLAMTFNAVDPDRLTYENTSNYQGQDAAIRVISVPPNTWEF